MVKGGIFVAFIKNIESSYGIVSYTIDDENSDGKLYFVGCDNSLLKRAKNNVHEFILDNTQKFG